MLHVQDKWECHNSTDCSVLEKCSDKDCTCRGLYFKQDCTCRGLNFKQEKRKANLKKLV